MDIDFRVLLANAKNGDAEALEEMHRRYGPAVGARVRQRLTPLLRRRHDTEDIRQSVFADVMRALPGFEDRGESAFRHWLLIKAENKIRDHLRRQLGRDGGHRETRLRSVVAGGVPCGDRGPASEAARRDDRERVTLLLATMEPSDREILEFRAHRALPFREVARRMRLPSADAARKRYAQALVRLRMRWKNA